MKDDPLWKTIPKAPPTATKAAKLREILKKPKYAEFQNEWNQKTNNGTKNARNLSWYSFFGGPKNVAALAESVDQMGVYEIMYRLFSDATHASDTMKSMSSSNGKVAIAPLREPTGGQFCAFMAATFCIEIATELEDFYNFSQAQKEDYATRYVQKLRAGQHKYEGKEILKINRSMSPVGSAIK